ncbi:hypothetical protein PMAYCL1PPCAC_04079, partial [Pristionchus mayeri]
LTGAIDVIVVEQPNGEFRSTPFHVRFGKYGVFNFMEKYVDISVNGKEVRDIRMKLGENGIAYFVQAPVDVVPECRVTSDAPAPAPASASGSASISASALASAPSPESASAPESASTSASTTDDRPAETICRNGAEADEDKMRKQERKMALPRLDSIYSMRRNRSLPDVALDVEGLPQGGEAVQIAAAASAGTPAVAAAAAASPVSSTATDGEEQSSSSSSSS